MEQEKIGKFIVLLRKEKGMTQQELANKLGITDRAVSKWENGRGMPDYSLIKPLCQELNITVNELLSGERIKKEEQEEKFEYNVLNTIDYSNKKIKHIKNIFRTILIIIILVILVFLTLFGIDIYRMRNNKPVFFSTWGLNYSVAVNLDDVKLESAIKEYLIKRESLNKHYDNERTFVELKTYLITENKDKFYVYTLIYTASYYKENEVVKKDSASVIPYKFELISKDGNFDVTNYIIPRDGSYYKNDMKKIFPINVLWSINRATTDGTYEKLALEIEEDKDLYFNN